MTTLSCPHWNMNTALVRSDSAWNASTRRAGLGWTTRTRNQRTSSTDTVDHVSSPLLAESLALRAALTECREMHVRDLRCEAYSSQLIRAVTSNSKSKEIYGIVADIKSLALSFVVISFCWIPRQMNSEADLLAKQSLSANQVNRVITTANQLYDD